MKANIFTKLLTTYLVIILITLFVVGLLFTQLFQNYFYNARENELLAKGQEVADIFSAQLLGLQDPRITNDLLFALDRFLDARVHPVDKSMLGLATCPGFEEMGLPLTVDELELLLQGHPVAKRGYHSVSREQLATVAVPIMVMDEVAGAVFLNAPLTGISHTVSQVQGLVFYAALLATSLAMVVGYYMSKSISHPLQQMNRAALEVAGGNYQQQVKVTSSDEVGQLAHSFNHMSSTLFQTVEALSQEKAKLENIMISMNEGVVAIDQQNRILLANPQAQQLLRLQKADLTGQKITTLLPDSAMPNLFSDVMQSDESHSHEYTEEGGRILSLQVAPLRRGEIIWGAVGILQDVTQVRHLEQMRRDFVANVSHELRTPMTSIQGFVEALLDGFAQDQKSQDRYLQVILDETIRLNRLVNDLLDLSRLETGQVSWPMEPLALPALIAQVATKLSSQFERQALTVKIEVPGNLPWVLGNRDRIQQVLINLLGNAISFTPSGGTVTLAASDEGDKVRIRVTDNGVGIPEEEHEKIWQRFYKVDKARTRRLGGTGLGLSIVKQIIEAHGGTADLESSPGSGSTFSFTLRRYEDPES
ncbi:MAG: cell wall metabolism sensor histidine kinase WalK [Firmicutes bacterium]|nr:cell wall metabolism sensor histidine kinase WalK [Bacillota bacterium]